MARTVAGVGSFNFLYMIPVQPFVGCMVQTYCSDFIYGN